MSGARLDQLRKNNGVLKKAVDDVKLQIGKKQLDMVNSDCLYLEMELCLMPLINCGSQRSFQYVDTLNNRGVQLFGILFVDVISKQI